MIRPLWQEQFWRGQFWRGRSAKLRSCLGLAILIASLIIGKVPAMARDSLLVSTQPLQGESVETQQSSPTTEHRSLLEEGRSFYAAGQFANAAASWQRVATLYGERGDRLNQALALSYLSLADQAMSNWEAAQAAIDQSLTLLKQVTLAGQSEQAILAHVLNTHGSLQFKLGQAEAALTTWQQAEAAYQAAADPQGMVGAQINQAEALQSLGFYRRAQGQLEQINTLLQDQPPLIKAIGLRSLGSLFQATGNLQQSRTVLEQSLAITQQLGQPEETSATLLSLGNTYQASRELEPALNAYEQAASLSSNSITQVEARLNQLNVLIQMQRWQEAQSLFSNLQTQVARLPASSQAIDARVNLSERWIQFQKQAPQPFQAPFPTVREIAEGLTIAVEQAKTIRDIRTEAIALGQLGKLYELTQQWNEARNLTQNALMLAQTVHADEIAYNWQWQLGRILKQQGEIQEAIRAYSNSVQTVRSLRNDLSVMKADLQFAFREQIEPIHRELVSLLLQDAQPTQENLKQAREVIESLRLAELENFFRSACLDVVPRQIDEIDPQAAVVYPIILPDRLAVILSVPGEPLAYYANYLPQNRVEDTLEQLLQSLNPAFSDRVRLRLSEQVYTWLVRPAEASLTQHSIHTLVFVLDSILKNLPMAALYDGNQYLVEKYGVALAPGLQLLADQSPEEERFDVLMGGLSEARQGFAALSGVETEVETIASKVSVNSLLLNQQFTKVNLEQGMVERQPSAIHLATHGQFGSNPEETFILTWDDRIDIQDLYALLKARTLNERRPLELLILSACQTASGDERAALGLAGLAVRSGARSTIASLWAVNDESTTKLMTEFYQALIQTHTANRAEILRQAQLALLKTPLYAHPYYWAAFVLVGNWV